jgi:hypothetical protein
MKRSLPMMTPHQEQRIKIIFQEFVKGRYEKVRKLSLDSLQINPFFLRQLAEHLQWTSARDIVQFLVDETFQRGIITSAGFRAEQIVRVVITHLDFMERNDDGVCRGRTSRLVAMGQYWLEG